MAMLPENGVQGLMTGILGSAAALAIAFPLALGGSVYDPAAATGAARTGLYATNGAGSESVGIVTGGNAHGAAFTNATNGTQLSVSAGQDTTHSLGQGVLGLVTSGTAGAFYIAQAGNTTSTAYGFSQTSSGNTVLNAPTGSSVFVRINNGSAPSLAQFAATAVTIGSGAVLNVTNTTASTTTGTGCLTLGGGLGVGGAVFSGGIVTGNGIQSANGAIQNASTVASIICGTNTSTFAQFTCNGAAGIARSYAMQTAGNNRWNFYADSSSESGSNAGSNFNISAYTDLGAFIDSPLQITRASGGTMTLSRPIAATNSTASTTAATGAVVISGGLGVAGAFNVTGLIKTGSTTLIASSVALTNNAGSSAGTLTNAPSVGNPTKWIPINDNGTTRNIPAW